MKFTGGSLKNFLGGGKCAAAAEDRAATPIRIRRADKREAMRIETLRAADVFLGEGRSPVACLVRDVSETGLRLLIETPHKLPEQLRLVLNHPRQERTCRVMWQLEGEVGLMFIE